MVALRIAFGLGACLSAMVLGIAVAFGQNSLSVMFLAMTVAFLGLSFRH